MPGPEALVLAAGGLGAVLMGAVAVVAGPDVAIVLAITLIAAIAVLVRGLEEYLIVVAATHVLPWGSDQVGWLALWVPMTAIIIGGLRIDSARAQGAGSKWAIGLYLAVIAVFALGTMVADVDDPNGGLDTLVRLLIVPLFLVAFIRLLRHRGPLHARTALVLVSAIAGASFILLTAQAGNLGQALTFANVQATKGTLFEGLEDNANTYAFYLMIGLAPLVAWYLTARTRRQALWLAAGGLVTVVALLIASSRSAMLGGFVGIAVVLLLLLGATWRRAAAILVMTGVGLWFLAPAASELAYESDNFTGRTQVWDVAGDLWRQSPLVGHGPESWVPLTTQQARIVPEGGDAHNIYMTMLVEGGVLGLLALIAFVVAVVVMGATATRRYIVAGRMPDAGIAAGATGAVASVLTRGIFESSGIFQRPQWLDLLTCAAVALVVVSWERSRGLPAADASARPTIPIASRRARPRAAAAHGSAGAALLPWPAGGDETAPGDPPGPPPGDEQAAALTGPPAGPAPRSEEAPAASTDEPRPTDAQERSRAGRGALFQTAGRAVALTVNLLTFAVMLRELGVVGFGYVTIALAVTGIIGIFLVAGIDDLLFRDLSVTPTSAVLTEAFALRLGLTLLIVPAYLITVLLLPLEGDLRVALLAAAAVMAVSPIASLVQILRSQVLLVPIAIMDVVSSLFVLGTLLLLSAGGLEPAHALLAMAGGNLVQYGVTGYLGLRRVPLRPSSVRRGFVRRIAREAKYVLGGTLVGWGYFRVDVLILGAVASAAAVGGYGAAHRLVDVGLYLPMIIVGAYFPGIARLWGRRRQLSGYLTWVSERLILLAGIVACGGILFGEISLRLLGGSEYGGLGAIVALLMTALALMFVNLLFLEVLLAGRALAVRLLSYIAAMVATFGVGLPLILILGAEGAAIGKLVTEVVLALSAGWAVYARSGWRPPLVPSALAVGGTLVATGVATLTGEIVLRVLAALVLAGVAAVVMVPRLRRTSEEEQPA